MTVPSLSSSKILPTLVGPLYLRNEQTTYSTIQMVAPGADLDQLDLVFYTQALLLVTLKLDCSSVITCTYHFGCSTITSFVPTTITQAMAFSATIHRVIVKSTALSHLVCSYTPQSSTHQILGEEVQTTILILTRRHQHSHVVITSSILHF